MHCSGQCQNSGHMPQLPMMALTYRMACRTCFGDDISLFAKTNQTGRSMFLLDNFVKQKTQKYKLNNMHQNDDPHVRIATTTSVTKSWGRTHVLRSKMWTAVDFKNIDVKYRPAVLPFTRFVDAKQPLFWGSSRIGPT